MFDELQLASAKKVLEVAKEYKPLVKTPLDHTCHIINTTITLLLEQHIAELKRRDNAPQDRGS